METLFGAAGVVAAPILYAYMKNELTALGLIGINKEATMIETDKTEMAAKAKTITKN
jgi:predicted PurR-regulated permease PerM